MSVLKRALLIFCCGTILVSFTACKKEGPAERAGRNIDETVDSAGKKANDATEKAGEKIEEAGEKIKESTK